MTAKVRNVVLAAPDVDVDVFATQWRSIGQPRPRLTVFTSRDDAALRASRLLAGDVRAVGQIDPTAEPYHTALANAGIDVIDISDLQGVDRLNHSTFAENPEIVQRIGQRLIAGETFSSAGESLGERVDGFAMGVGQTVGGAAGIAVSAPIAVVDPNSRRTFDEEVDHLGHVVDETVDQAEEPDQ